MTHETSIGYQSTGNWSISNFSTGHFSTEDYSGFGAFNKPCTPEEWNRAKNLTLSTSTSLKGYLLRT